MATVLASDKVRPPPTRPCVGVNAEDIDDIAARGDRNVAAAERGHPLLETARN